VQKETKSLAFGSLAHTAFLEPDELPRRYYPVDFILNERSKAYQDAVVQAAGREIVKRADYDAAQRMRDAVLKQSAVARDMMIVDQHLLIEQSMYWRDDETGLLRRGRADGIRTDYHVMFDLKSTRDASRYGFSAAIRTYKYHWQHPYYVDGAIATLGWEPEAFIFFAVEPEPPWLVAPYEILPEDCEEGRRAFRHQLHRYKACLDRDEWPGLPADQIQPLEVFTPRNFT